MGRSRTQSEEGQAAETSEIAKRSLGGKRKTRELAVWSQNYQGILTTEWGRVGVRKLLECWNVQIQVQKHKEKCEGCDTEVIGPL